MKALHLLVVIFLIPFCGFTQVLEPSGEQSPFSVPADRNGSGPVGELVWSQQAILWVQASQIDPVQFTAWSVNDFILPEEKAITGVRWWGGYWNPAQPGAPSAFVITFWDDNGCEPGNVLEEFTIPFGNCHEEQWVSWLTNYFSYWAELPESFVAEASTQYWISIQAVMYYPPQWGWARSYENEVLECAAVEKFPEIGWTDWLPFDPNYDLGYELYSSVEIPVRNWALGIGVALIAIFAILRFRRGY